MQRRKAWQGGARAAAAVLLTGALVGSGAALSSAVAAPAGTTLEDSVRLGPHWYGPEISKEELEGRVVLIEDWGIN